MSYAALTGTIDAFEAVLALLLLVAWWFAARNVREGWTEKEWALDDPSPVMRRLGAVRYDNARLLSVVVFCVTVVDLLLMLTPSAIQTMEGATEVLVSVGSRSALTPSSCHRRVIPVAAGCDGLVKRYQWPRWTDSSQGRRPRRSDGDGVSACG